MAEEAERLTVSVTGAGATLLGESGEACRLLLLAQEYARPTPAPPARYIIPAISSSLLPSLLPLPRSAMAPPHQFQSKPSDAIRRRLSSVVSTKRPNVHAYSSLTVRRSLPLVPLPDPHPSVVHNQ